MAGKAIHSMQDLPRVRDGWTFLFVEHARIERRDSAIEILEESGRIPVPIAALSALLLGPGTSVTHAAMAALAESGCSVVWLGEGLTRFYASGMGETRLAGNLLAQAQAWADPEKRLAVVFRMYRHRFGADELSDGLTIEQVRGHEGVRVREAYARASEMYGIEWRGRNYKKGSWDGTDAVNRALSAANACLYALCHAAIVATGFSPGLGFIHTGKQLSFVYDIADLYKVNITVPVAFREAAGGSDKLESRVRRACRDAFYQHRLLEAVVPDIQRVLGLKEESARFLTIRSLDDADPFLWDPTAGVVAGGRSFADKADEDDDEVPF